MATPEKIAALADFVDRLEQLTYDTHMLPEHEAERGVQPSFRCPADGSRAAGDVSCPYRQHAGRCRVL